MSGANRPSERIREYPNTAAEDGLRDILAALPFIAEQQTADIARHVAEQAATRLTEAAKAYR